MLGTKHISISRITTSAALMIAIGAGNGAYGLPIKNLIPPSVSGTERNLEQVLLEVQKKQIIARTIYRSREQNQLFSSKRPNSCEATYFGYFARNPGLVKTHIERVFAQISEVKDAEDAAKEHGTAKEPITDLRVLRIFRQAKEDLLAVLKTDVHFRWDRGLQTIWKNRLVHLNL